VDITPLLLEIATETHAKAKQGKEVLTKAQAVASMPSKLHIYFIQNAYYQSKVLMKLLFPIPVKILIVQELVYSLFLNESVILAEMRDSRKLFFYDVKLHT